LEQATDTPPAGSNEPLAWGRTCCARQAWAEAYQAFADAEQQGPLGADELELLALSAYMSGRDDHYLAALERAYHARHEAGESHGAARCAFWLGLRLAFRREMGPATGWFARAHRLIEAEARACAEEGWLLLPVAEQQLDAGAPDAAYEAAERAAAIGGHFQDSDLVACARHLQGRVRVRQGDLPQGLALLDEAMIAVIAGELSPIVTGLIYCSVIGACQEVFATSRAREWTAALTRWCAAQPQMVAFTGTCLVHRAEILQLNGDWDEAIEESRRAVRRLALTNNSRDAAAACYREAEIYRLRGTFAEAEAAFRRASDLGLEPQPGFALLRVAQGRVRAAAAAIRRALNATGDRLERARLLPAQVEILLLAGEVDEAVSGCQELEDIAAVFGPGILAAAAAQSRGALLLAQGDAQAALVPLRSAWHAWQEVHAPYDAARTRVLMALACRALGDCDGAQLALEGAHRTFAKLGAAPDVVRVEALAGEYRPERLHGLTQRELQVLRLVAAGGTNKTIAAELCRSERTVDRHLSNILAKLEVRSRAAATAWAYQHGLV
jgi:ATP/maltotriose-dependent transcriptional regulator MalT